jgi:hypothetical protein
MTILRVSEKCVRRRVSGSEGADLMRRGKRITQ